MRIKTAKKASEILQKINKIDSALSQDVVQMTCSSAALFGRDWLSDVVETALKRERNKLTVEIAKI